MQFNKENSKCHFNSVNNFFGDQSKLYSTEEKLSRIIFHFSGSVLYLNDIEFLLSGKEGGAA